MLNFYNYIYFSIKLVSWSVRMDVGISWWGNLAPVEDCRHKSITQTALQTNLQTIVLNWWFPGKIVDRRANKMPKKNRKQVTLNSPNYQFWTGSLQLIHSCWNLWSTLITTALPAAISQFRQIGLKNHYIRKFFKHFATIHWTETIVQLLNCTLQAPLRRASGSGALEPLRGEKSQVQTVWLHVDDWLKSVRNDDLKAPSNRSTIATHSGQWKFCRLLLLPFAMLVSRPTSPSPLPLGEKRGQNFPISRSDSSGSIALPPALILSAPSGAWLGFSRRRLRRQAPNHRSRPSNNNRRHRGISCIKELLATVVVTNASVTVDFVRDERPTTMMGSDGKVKQKQWVGGGNPSASARTDIVVIFLLPRPAVDFHAFRSARAYSWFGDLLIWVERGKWMGDFAEMNTMYFPRNNVMVVICEIKSVCN